MAKRAFAEVTLDASPVEVSNSLVFIMELQKSHPRVERISEKPQQIELWVKMECLFVLGVNLSKLL